MDKVSFPLLQGSGWSSAKLTEPILGGCHCNINTHLEQMWLKHETLNKQLPQIQCHCVSSYVLLMQRIGEARRAGCTPCSSLADGLSNGSLEKWFPVDTALHLTERFPCKNLTQEKDMSKVRLCNIFQWTLTSVLLFYLSLIWIVCYVLSLLISLCDCLIHTCLWRRSKSSELHTCTSVSLIQWSGRTRSRPVHLLHSYGSLSFSSAQWDNLEVQSRKPRGQMIKIQP